MIPTVLGPVTGGSGYLTHYVMGVPAGAAPGDLAILTVTGAVPTVLGATPTPGVAGFNQIGPTTTVWQRTLDGTEIGVTVTFAKKAATKASLLVVKQIPVPATPTPPVLPWPNLTTFEHPFPNSIYTTPLPADPVLDPDNVRLTANFLAMVNTAVTLNYYQNTNSIYVVGAGVPTYQVEPRANAGTCRTVALAAVPIPAGAIGAGGSDREISIWQPATNTLWEMNNFTQAPDGTYHSSWGGKMPTGAGVPSAFPSGWGASASGLPCIATTILLAELEAGVIPHALSCCIPRTAPGFRAPANRSDSSSTPDPTAIQEGTLLQLDPAADVSKLNPVAKAVAVALQTYGCYVTDVSTVVGFSCEDDTRYDLCGMPSPWTALLGTYKGYTILNSIPWASMRILAFPAPM